MSDAVHYQVVIAGGGLVGSSAALMLARRGVRVALFERRYCGAQASGVNYGGVRCQGRPVEQMPLAMRARRVWDRLPELIGIDGELVVSGHLRLARRDSDFAVLQTWAAMAREHGLETELIAGAAFRRRYPWLGEAALGGSLCTSDGQANPRLVSPAFARAAQRAGAIVREQTALTDIAHDGTRFQIRAGNEHITADWLINSAGAWANTIAGFFGEAVPMKPIYPNMWVTEPLPRVVMHNLGVVGGGVYARQVERGNCVIGGGRGHGDGEYAQPSTDTTRAVMRDACALLPFLRDALLIRTWSGVEGETPDSHPVIGASRKVPRLLHAFGFSGGGFLLAPGVGEVLADLVIDGETSTPLDAFAICRFDRSTIPAVLQSCQGDPR
ncbi:FAD-binding oxidoreductase [Paraburkholderia phymatum]|uniref:FAD dependent oxidoreductase n=1 Tax=Paraburkholderia phymatum (strain DSM 17167 / CIP 108236 / LMG 21445 / STM815) TaxID=391038 RepID=B2JSV0_PARP8|nr:FAD-binding oxidoreductase [Paraburkholderia phymatum]ACC75653.1 FAD dependent oxidoreductase [Paraburkholderia phymatum STM815]